MAIFPLRSLCQDFTGVWTGYIFTSNIRMPYELVISEANNKLKGYSLTVFTINDIENTGIKSMKIKGKKGKIAIEDDDLIFNDYAKRPKRVVLYSTLYLEEEDDSILVLQGSFFTRSTRPIHIYRYDPVGKKQKFFRSKNGTPVKENGLME